MEQKPQMDTFGAMALTAFALHLAFNQVVIKVTADGFGPIFAAGVRSVGAACVLLLWIWFRGVPFAVSRSMVPAGVLSGLLFALEFLLLFSALDFTTVSRASVIFYSMPVWLALASHFLLPGDRMTRLKGAGLVLATMGVALALLDRGDATASLAGDLMALSAAICWAAIALCLKITSIKTMPPAQQLMFQVVVSAPILLFVAILAGDMIREPRFIHYAGMIFQIVGVASFGFLFWFWLLKIYPASAVASFSFLSPVFAVLLGWFLLGEVVGVRVWIALVLVSVGIYLINRKPTRV
ncbi:MAG: DMT family transporter [Roseobacter sp.]